MGYSVVDTSDHWVRQVRILVVARVLNSNPSNAEATLIRPKHREAKIFENHLNPVMLVFIG